MFWENLLSKIPCWAPDLPDPNVCLPLRRQGRGMGLSHISDIIRFCPHCNLTYRSTRCLCILCLTPFLTRLCKQIYHIHSHKDFTLMGVNWLGINFSSLCYIGLAGCWLFAGFFFFFEQRAGAKPGEQCCGQACVEMHCGSAGWLLWWSGRLCAGCSWVAPLSPLIRETCDLA